MAETLRRLLILAPGLAATAACGLAPPTSVEDEIGRRDGLVLILDTLDVEVQNLWVRISAIPAVRQDLVVTWELEAATGNPFWRPKAFQKAGGRHFDSPDTARVWGNVPRAYDFRLVATGRTQAGEFASDTLVIAAPVCRDRNRPTLLCNVGVGGPELRGSDGRHGPGAVLGRPKIDTGPPSRRGAPG